MDVFQATLNCAECKQSNKVLIARELGSPDCENCGANLIKIKRFDGVIYVLKNKHVRGVKVGRSNDVYRRAKEVSGTGTPGSFDLMAAFPSHNAKQDERKVHEKMKSKRIAKEHFELEPDEAIVKVRTALGGRDWVLIHKSMRAKVEQRIEEQRTKAKLKFQTKKPEASPSQIELFGQANDEPKVKEEESKSVVTPAKGKGFLAHLFQK